MQLTSIKLINRIDLRFSTVDRVSFLKRVDLMHTSPGPVSTRGSALGPMISALTKTDKKNAMANRINGINRIS